MLKLLMFPILLLTLGGCDQSLHFKIRFDDAGGLKAGDPLVLENQTVGSVVAVEPAAEGGTLAAVALERQFSGAATVDSRFYLMDAPDKPGAKYIEIVQTHPGGKPLEQDAVVEGSRPEPFGALPFGELFKQLGGVLRGLRDQVERYRRDFQQAPDSPEARQLQQEWQRLQEEIEKAQRDAEGSIQKDLLPKLQQRLDELRKRLQELDQPPARKTKPLET